MAPPGHRWKPFYPSESKFGREVRKKHRNIHNQFSIYQGIFSQLGRRLPHFFHSSLFSAIRVHSCSFISLHVLMFPSQLVLDSPLGLVPSAFPFNTSLSLGHKCITNCYERRTNDFQTMEIREDNGKTGRFVRNYRSFEHL